MTAVQSKCPNCGAPLVISAWQMQLRRVACQACSVRCDVVFQPHAPDSPFRAAANHFDLMSEPPVPEDDMADLSGERYFRHVRIRRRTRGSILIGAGYLIVGILAVTGMCTFMTVERGDGDTVPLSLALVFVPAFVMATLLALFHTGEEVWIDGGQLHWRRGPLTHRRVDLGDITEVETAGELYMYIEVRGPRTPVRIARGLGHGFEAIEWLARHLQNGVRRART